MSNRIGIYGEDNKPSNRDIRRALVNKRIKRYDHRGQEIKLSRFKTKRTKRI